MWTWPGRRDVKWEPGQGEEMYNVNLARVKRNVMWTLPGHRDIYVNLVRAERYIMWTWHRHRDIYVNLVRAERYIMWTWHRHREIQWEPCQGGVMFNMILARAERYIMWTWPGLRDIEYNVNLAMTERYRMSTISQAQNKLNLYHYQDTSLNLFM